MRLVYKLAAVCVLIFATPVTVAASTERYLSRYHSISIEVECIETAREIINELNGFNLDSSAYFRDTQRVADFTRKVDDWAFRHVQEVLRGMGKVLNESENANYLGAEIADIETRILVLSQEMERLSLLMAASDSLSVLIAVNDRLNNVSRDRDNLIGRINVLNAEISAPIIKIHLVETPEEPEKPIPERFGERVSDAFLKSWKNTCIAAENTLIWFAGSIIAIVTWVIVGGIVGAVFYKVRKKRKTVIKEVKNETE